MSTQFDVQSCVCETEELLNELLFRILPVVLYGCEAWSLTLREERRLKVFENRVLRGVFGPKRDEVTGELKKIT
jgi:hypothetical protein